MSHFLWRPCQRPIVGAGSRDRSRAGRRSLGRRSLLRGISKVVSALSGLSALGLTSDFLSSEAGLRVHNHRDEPALVIGFLETLKILSSRDQG